MRITHLLALFCAFLRPAWASEALVSMRWVNPPKHYLSTLKACGVEVNAEAGVQYFKLPELHCSGVIDFNQSPELRARLGRRIQRAIENGHEAIGGHSLARLLEQLPEVQFAISYYGNFLTTDDGYGELREAAINLREERLVILNYAHWKPLAPQQDGDALLVHEFFGVAGVEDRDYHHSALLYLHSQAAHVAGDGDNEHDLPEAAELQKKAKNQKFAEERGGGTVVGRGGNPTGPLFKAGLLRLSQEYPAAGLRSTILLTPVTVGNRSAFQVREACWDPEKNEHSRLHCGDFILKGNKHTLGRPFLQVSDEWAELSAYEQEKLLRKILRSMQRQLQASENSH